MDDKIYPTYKAAKLEAILHEQGISAEELLEATGISPPELTSNTARISRRQLAQIYRNAIRVSKDPTIGLIAGHRLCLTDYGIYGYALISSATLRKALEFSIKYHQMATPTVRMSLLVDEDDGTAIFRMEDKLGIRELYQFNLEMQFSLVFSLFKDMAGRDFRFSEIWASYSRPPYADAYEALFECPVRFEMPHNDLIFDTAWLDGPLERANPITEATTRELCDQVLLEMETREGIAHRVYEIITKDLRQHSSLESVARALNMSSRTLRRKLAAQGPTFQKILNEVRQQLAIEFLRNTDMSSEEIADRLGFSDAANFRHAFKKWTDKTPSAFR